MSVGSTKISYSSWKLACNDSTSHRPSGVRRLARWLPSMLIGRPTDPSSESWSTSRRQFHSFSPVAPGTIQAFGLSSLDLPRRHVTQGDDSRTSSFPRRKRQSCSWRGGVLANERLAFSMKSFTSLFVVIVTLGGCHSRQPVIFANSEGLRIGEEPPLFRPGRTPDARLRTANRGRLIVRTEVGSVPSSVRVALNGPDANARRLEQVSTSSGTTEFSDLEPGEYAATARRVGLRPQTVRFEIAAGFTDTLLFSLGQP